MSKNVRDSVFKFEGWIENKQEQSRGDVYFSINNANHMLFINYLEVYYCSAEVVEY